MPDILSSVAAWAQYQRILRIYPGRAGTRATIGKRRRHKTGDKYAGKRLNKAHECARRQRQIERGMLRVG